jgi:hypothetical protein
MRRLFAKGLAAATGVVVLLMSALFALLRVVAPRPAPSAGHGL